MPSRRSRFVRIYHRWTRRSPNRGAQWSQIAQLRVQGKPGYRSATGSARVAAAACPDETERMPRPRRAVGRRSPSSSVPPEIILGPGDLFDLEQVEPVAPRPPALGIYQGIGQTVAVASLVAALFLLACAYAAFSGYERSYNEGYAFIGVAGAIGSLLAAGVGVCLATSAFHRHYSGRFLGICAISLATLYGALLVLAAGGR